MSDTNNQHSANIDPEEIAKFEELASRWWDKESEFKPLHDINPLRVGFIDKQASLAGKKFWMLAVVAEYCQNQWLSAVLK